MRFCIILPPITSLPYSYLSLPVASQASQLLKQLQQKAAVAAIERETLASSAARLRSTAARKAIAALRPAASTSAASSSHSDKVACVSTPRSADVPVEDEDSDGGDATAAGAVTRGASALAACKRSLCVSERACMRMSSGWSYPWLLSRRPHRMCNNDDCFMPCRRQRILLF